MAAWSLDVGILVGFYCIETWFFLLGIVISDIFQAACRRITSRKIEEEPKPTGLGTNRQGGLGGSLV